MEIFRGGPAIFFFFFKHMNGTVFVPFSVEMSRRKLATEFPLANTLLSVYTSEEGFSTFSTILNGRKSS